ncbi:hypothetical protein L1887_44525 [Cichorium endivia]|nr:hypothetical protein L1887_44525 [Cichorium endivia]
MLKPQGTQQQQSWIHTVALAHIWLAAERSLFESAQGGTTAKTLETRICLGSTTSLFARGTLSRLAVPPDPAQMSRGGRGRGRDHRELARAYDRKRQVTAADRITARRPGESATQSHAESCNPGCKLLQPMQQQRRLGSADVFGSCDPRMHVSFASTSAAALDFDVVHALCRHPPVLRFLLSQSWLQVSLCITECRKQDRTKMDPCSLSGCHRAQRIVLEPCSRVVPRHEGVPLCLVSASLRSDPGLSYVRGWHARGTPKKSGGCSTQGGIIAGIYQKK